jgi:hypothetical protein
MQHENTVENLLQLQLSSDALAVLYLPSILSILSPIHFSSDAKDSFSTKTGASTGNANNAASPRVSPMTPALLNKWCTRVMSLMQSKDAGARWAGICLARRTGELRREVVVEYAQRWINLTLPCLSVRSFRLFGVHYPCAGCAIVWLDTDWHLWHSEGGTASCLEGSD